MELEKTGFDLEGRVLCSDEACIGVIGSDGRCKECGKPYEGDEPLSEASKADGATPDDPAPDGEGEAPDGGEAPDDDGEAPVPGARKSDTPAPLERVPCSDEACIGIIGRDGKCGTCGRPR